MDAIQALKRTMLFGELDEADLEALATRVVAPRLKRGEMLFMEGDPAGGLYVLVLTDRFICVNNPYSDIV